MSDKHQISPDGTAHDALLTKVDLEQLLGLTFVSIWTLIKRGEFPQPILVSPKNPRWKSDEVRAWIDTRPRRSYARGESAAPQRRKSATAD